MNLARFASDVISVLGCDCVSFPPKCDSCLWFAPFIPPKRIKRENGQAKFRSWPFLRLGLLHGSVSHFSFCRPFRNSCWRFNCPQWEPVSPISSAGRDLIQPAVNSAFCRLLMLICRGSWTWIKKRAFHFPLVNILDPHNTKRPFNKHKLVSAKKKRTLKFYTRTKKLCLIKGTR